MVRTLISRLDTRTEYTKGLYGGNMDTLLIMRKCWSHTVCNKSGSTSGRYDGGAESTYSLWNSQILAISKIQVSALQ